ncbi:MAG: DUF3024 domain-containing protein [Porticoccaceae bacterium]
MVHLCRVVYSLNRVSAGDGQDHYALVSRQQTMTATDMAFSEFETKRLKKVVGAFIEKHRPAPHIRSKLDLAFRINGQSIEIFEIRPRWKGAPGETMEHRVAKATYVKTQELWRVFWMRADLKWHSYPPVPRVGSVEEFLALVAEDKHACFFG